MQAFWLALVVAAQIPAAREPSVRALIHRAPGGSDGSAIVTVRLDVREIRLGAYQGSVRFEPGTLEVLVAESPRGDGTRVVNPADTAQGIVRFAGFAVNGFRTDSVLVLRLRARRGFDAARLRVELDVASDVDGRALPRAALRGAKATRIGGYPLADNAGVATYGSSNRSRAAATTISVAAGIPTRAVSMHKS